MKRCKKNVIFCIFFAFFLQLTIRPLHRFFGIYLLFSFFCRNFASDFVTNSRGKSETSRGPRQNLQSNVLVRISESSGSPKAIARLVLGKIGGTRRLNERGAVSPCDRVADDFVPFHRAIIEPLSMHYRSNHEINCCQLLIIIDHFFFVCKLLPIVDNC